MMVFSNHTSINCETVKPTFSQMVSVGQLYSSYSSLLKRTLPMSQYYDAKGR